MLPLTTLDIPTLNPHRAGNATTSLTHIETRLAIGFQLEMILTLVIDVALQARFLAAVLEHFSTIGAVVAYAALLG